MIHEPTNTGRAKRFDRLLRRYDTDESNHYRLIDLLADARHWCDRHNKCYGDLDRMAYDHYLAELWDERWAS